MASSETQLEDGIDFVIVATPNHLHVPVARAFLEAGIPVACDKPLASSLDDARELARLVATRGIPFLLTHTYAGYPAVRQARAMVRSGELGDIRKVHVEYLQDWLMTPLEASGQKQASWRVDPQKAGLGGALGDIGTHAHHLVEFVTGSPVASVCADVSTFVPGRKLDDDANVLLRLANGAKGTLVCSQVACGEENDLWIRVYGTKASLEWRQQEPNTLLFAPAGDAVRVLRTGKGFASAEAAASTRLPAGHPEGYVESFASLYRSFAADVRRAGRGEKLLRDYPGVSEGLRGLEFVAATLESSAAGSGWVAIAV
jgi:predicted dehydrogenase